MTFITFVFLPFTYFEIYFLGLYYFHLCLSVFREAKLFSRSSLKAREEGSWSREKKYREWTEKGGSWKSEAVIAKDDLGLVMFPVLDIWLFEERRKWTNVLEFYRTSVHLRWKVCFTPRPRVEFPFSRKYFSGGGEREHFHPDFIMRVNVRWDLKIDVVLQTVLYCKLQNLLKYIFSICWQRRKTRTVEN